MEVPAAVPAAAVPAAAATAAEAIAAATAAKPAAAAIVIVLGTKHFVAKAAAAAIVKVPKSVSISALWLSRALGDQKHAPGVQNSSGPSGYRGGRRVHASRRRRLLIVFLLAAIEGVLGPVGCLTPLRGSQLAAQVKGRVADFIS